MIYKNNLFGTQGSQYNTKRLIEKRVLFKSPLFSYFPVQIEKPIICYLCNGKKEKRETFVLKKKKQLEKDRTMAFSSLKDVFDLPSFLSGLRHHPLYHSMGPYPYSLLTTADVPQFSPWWVELIFGGFTICQMNNIWDTRQLFFYLAIIFGLCGPTMPT